MHELARASALHRPPLHDAFRSVTNCAMYDDTLSIPGFVAQEYESGKAIPNGAMISKIERALGVHLPRPAKKK